MIEQNKTINGWKKLSDYLNIEQTTLRNKFEEYQEKFLALGIKINIIKNTIYKDGRSSAIFEVNLLDNYVPFYTSKKLVNKYKLKPSRVKIPSGDLTTFFFMRGIEVKSFKLKGDIFLYTVLNTSLYDEDYKTYPKDPRYEVSKEGHVRNCDTKVICGSRCPTTDYLRMNILNSPTGKKRYQIHRVVMETYCPIENDDEYIVDHINGKRDDNRLENLRWVTQRDNMIAKNENFAKINTNLQKMIQKYGYDELNKIFEQMLNE